MPNTTRGYPYPLTSATPNVPADLQSLATAVDTDVATVATTANDLDILTLMGAR